MQGLIQDFWLGGVTITIIMLEYQTCIRYVIVLPAILHILIGIGLTNKLQSK